MSALVAILMGSKSDMETMQSCMDTLAKFKIEHEVHVMSAHRTPEKVREFVSSARERGFEVVVGVETEIEDHGRFFGALFQYPMTTGEIRDYRESIQAFQAAGALVAMAADLLALTLLTPPGELGADISV